MLEISKHVFICGAATADPSQPAQTSDGVLAVRTDMAGNLYANLVVASPGSAGAVVPFALTSLITISAPNQEGILTASVGYLYNGADSDSFIRARSFAADNMDPTPGQGPSGVALVNEGPEWSLPHTPGIGVRATMTRAAVANARHVCRGISAQFYVAAADAPTSGTFLLLRDGATGAGTVLWARRIVALTAATDQPVRIDITGLNIVGSENTAMTLEFSAAPGAASFQDLTLSGRTADMGA